MKRVVILQDLSCFGTCSLTISLPILSAAGIEVCPLPHMVLSTHTGGFTDIARADLSAFAADAIRHWQSIGIVFDAIYIGYLGNTHHFDVAHALIDAFRTENTLLLVDPAMGDNGKLYNGCEADFPARMAALCAIADVIVPNCTEAAFILQQPYRKHVDMDCASVLLQDLQKLGARNVALTGIETDAGQYGAAYLTTDQLCGSATASYIDGMYHGAGDLFSSCLVAALLRGLPFPRGVAVAKDFVHLVIAQSARDGGDTRFGLRFEPLLPKLQALLGI